MPKGMQGDSSRCPCCRCQARHSPASVPLRGSGCAHGLRGGQGQILAALALLPDRSSSQNWLEAAVGSARAVNAAVALVAGSPWIY